MWHSAWLWLPLLASFQLVTGLYCLRYVRKLRRAQNALLQANHDLQNQLQLFEAIGRNASESIIVTRPDETIRYVNPAFSHLLGYNAEEVIGKKPSYFRSGQQDAESYAHLKQALANNLPWQGVFANRCKNGSLIHLDTIISPVASPDNAPIGFIAVGRDLTHEKELEGQLRHAHKMEAIGTLAGGIAHDFNNILSAVIGYTELAILDEQDGAPIKTNLEQILRASRRAADLVSQILTFSRRSSSDRQALYLGPILKESLKFLRGTLPTSIDIESTFSDETPPILADTTQMHQVIMNLCTNAAHAMQTKGGRLMVALDGLRINGKRAPWQAQLPSGSYARLVVTDTGHGIAPEIMSRIFEPYFTTKRGGDGTGLGLATVHGIVKSHGGTVHVNSDTTTGTSFTVLLPACAPDKIFPTAENAIPPPVKGNQENILIIDDEESIVMMISTALTYLGYKTHPYASSVKALEAFEKNPASYDCIITDQTMPTLSGADLAQRVLRIRPDIPIILCSGYSDVINESTAKEIGIAKFIMKPATGHTLAEAVHRLLQAKPA